jgi:hypothetical protein
MDATDKNIGKIAGYLNLALRAGALVLGVDNIRQAKRKLYVALADTGLSAGSLERLKRFVAEKRIPLYVFEGNLSDFAHKQNCRAAALSDGNLWNGIRPHIESAETFKRLDNDAG